MLTHLTVAVIKTIANLIHLPQSSKFNLKKIPWLFPRKAKNLKEKTWKSQQCYPNLQSKWQTSLTLNSKYLQFPLISTIKSPGSLKFNKLHFPPKNKSSSKSSSLLISSVWIYLKCAIYSPFDAKNRIAIPIGDYSSMRFHLKPSDNKLSCLSLHSFLILFSQTFVYTLSHQILCSLPFQLCLLRQIPSPSSFADKFVPD